MASKIEPGAKCRINNRALTEEWRGKRVEALHRRWPDDSINDDDAVWMVRIVDELGPIDRYQPGCEVSIAGFKLDVVEE